MESDKKVLVVDDDAFIRRLLEVKLKKQGYTVREAKNGQEGLSVITDWQPVVVILDINMPIMDGRTLCQQTNVIKNERPFLTIMVTARINPDDQQWVESMQDTLLMEKPFSPAKIIECIQTYLGQYH